MNDVHVSVIATAAVAYLGDCLRSVERSEGVSLATTVVDNVSTDGSRELVETEFPGVQVVTNVERLGFGANHNQVIRQVVAERSARYILVLNDDVELGPETLQTLVAACDADARVGGAVAQLVGPDGQEQQTTFSYPTPLDEVRRTLGRPARRPRTDAAWLNGACLLLRTDALAEVGGFDERRLFFYFEDTDLCRRLADAGWRLILCADTTALHHEHATISSLGPWTSRQFHRSRYVYLRKHAGPARARAAGYGVRLGLLIRAAKAAFDTPEQASGLLALARYDPRVPITRPTGVPRILTVGASRSGDACGVRDSDGVLRAALERGGVRAHRVWVESGPRSWSAAGELADEVDDEITSRSADAVVWHYSAFALTHRGVSLGSFRLARRLTRLELPVVVLCHELAYDFGRRGWRGLTQAVTQRVALRFALRGASGLIATTPARAAWLRSRRWLRGVPVEFAPLFATVAATGEPSGPAPLVGVFGFRHEDAEPEVVVAAFGRVAASRDAQLLLIGAPGPASPQADAWRAAAVRHGCAERLAFSGLLDPAELAATLGSVDVVVLPGASGPSSRMTTVATPLAAAKPVLAFDGSETWRELVDAGAVVAVPHAAEELAAALGLLLDGADVRAEQGARGRRFYEQRISPDRMAEQIVRLAAIDDGRRSPRSDASAAVALEAEPA